MGYYDTHVPQVIARNVLENPGWYTAYTPYQAEISQGRLEALLNFQQMVMDLTGMEMANASLLDEATAAAEAMALCKRAGKQPSNTFFVADQVHPQTLDVVLTRAKYFGFEVIVGPIEEIADNDIFGALVQYPGTSGEVRDLTPFIESAHDQQSAGCRRHGSIEPGTAQTAGRNGSRHCSRQCSTLWSADGIRRPACCLHGNA